jgi:magnesium-protoporphyrin O-methyltransferase
MTCRHCQGIEQMFDQKEAKRRLRRFRRRGPDRTTRLLIDELRNALGEQGQATLLDIGGGVGAIHHELLGRGAARAVHVDASTAYLAQAREESARRDHQDRMDFVHGDFVAVAGSLAPAEVVTLDRVICCYPDMRRLVGLAAERATRLLGAVYPRAVWWVRFGVAAGNVVLRIQRSAFRIFAHEPRDIDATLREAGLEQRFRRRTLSWEIVVYGRG